MRNQVIIERGLLHGDRQDNMAGLGHGCLDKHTLNVMVSLTSSKTINIYGIGKRIGLAQLCMICDTVLLFAVQVLFAFVFWQTLYIVMDNSSI